MGRYSGKPENAPSRRDAAESVPEAPSSSNQREVRTDAAGVHAAANEKVAHNWVLIGSDGRDGWITFHCDKCGRSVDTGIYTNTPSPDDMKMGGVYEDCNAEIVWTIQES